MDNEPLGMTPYLVISDDVVLGRCMYTLDASEADVVEAVDSTCEFELPNVVPGSVSVEDVILGGCMYTLVRSDVVMVTAVGLDVVGDDVSIAAEVLVSGYESTR